MPASVIIDIDTALFQCIVVMDDQLDYHYSALREKEKRSVGMDEKKRPRYETTRKLVKAALQELGDKPTERQVWDRVQKLAADRKEKPYARTETLRIYREDFKEVMVKSQS
ncbi:hypothetical protein [Desulfosarcina ovata]|nr:hypothetical protein [Desulfosarcina ovata]